MNMTKEELLSLLKNNIVTLVFQKKNSRIFKLPNGEFSSEKFIRKIVCTLVDSILEENNAIPKGKRKGNHSSIRVYDLENKGWRSFLFSNVIRIDEVQEVNRNPKSPQEYLFEED